MAGGLPDFQFASGSNGGSNAILQMVSKDLGSYALEILSMHPEQHTRLLIGNDQIFRRVQEILALPEAQRQVSYDEAVRELLLTGDAATMGALALQGKAWQEGTRNAIEHVVSVAELIALYCATANCQSSPS